MTASSFAGAAELEIEGVSKRFMLRREAQLLAVDGVTASIDHTSALGIVGESGSGKSTLARMLVGLERPTTGTIRFNGNDVASMSRASLREFRRAVQLVAQDTSSSFDPRRSLRDAVRLPAMRLGGLSRRDADDRVDQTLAILGVPPALADRRPSDVSGGQRQRFALARALVVRPRVLVCDEVVSALDVSVQGTILNFLRRYCEQHDAGIVFVSHGLPATAFIARQLLVMHRGRAVEHGDVRSVLEAPSHPYTAQLLAAHRSRPTVPAAVPASDDESAACRFFAWCDRSTNRCRDEVPTLATRGATAVACHHPPAADLEVVRA